MSRLIQRPDSPWNGFLDGALGAGVGAGLPLLITCLFRFWSAGPLRVLAFALAMAVGIAFLGGLGLALWRVVQGWAYDRLTGGPPA